MEPANPASEPTTEIRPARPPHPWDGFVHGPENALAVASASAVARGDLEGVSPLVVHGPSGSGKSRILAGLVGERLLRVPGSSLAHLEAEAFAAACAEAAGRPGGWAEVRSRFRAVDLFVLEDVHALERAPLALAELAHTLDALFDAGAAVAVSAREAPGHWRGWPPRLVSRFVGGLAVRVDPPGPESRRRYLLDRARARGVPLAAGAVDLLADRADGYRTLDGWLARLELTARVDRRPLDAALAGSALDDDGRGGGAPDGPTIARLAREVAATFGLTLRDLRGPTRRANVAGPRHLAMFLARERTDLSFRSIGVYFGNRDAATVRHACRAAAARLDADPALAAAVEPLRRRHTRADPAA